MSCTYCLEPSFILRKESGHTLCTACTINSLKFTFRTLTNGDYNQILESALMKTHPEMKEYILECQNLSNMIRSPSSRYCHKCCKFTTFQYSDYNVEIDDISPFNELEDSEIKIYIDTSQNKYTPIFCSDCKTEFCCHCRETHPNRSCVDVMYRDKKFWSNLTHIANNLRLPYVWRNYLGKLSRKEETNCPRCSVVISKNSGCNHMTCFYCTYEFCWVCQSNCKHNVHIQSNSLSCFNYTEPYNPFSPPLKFVSKITRGNLAFIAFISASLCGMGIIYYIISRLLM